LTEVACVRQVVQHLRTGAIELLDLPVPRPGAHEILIRTRRSLLSAGTERMLLEFGRAGLIGKALQQPERVRLLLDRLRTDGLGPVLEAAFNKLDEPLPLGYANAGTVIEAGADVHAFRAGDRVVSNAPHATWARVGANLCARVPERVTDEQAAFVVPAAIGLQGVRLAEPTIGETFAVIGTGLIGLLTVQLLTAAGCAVIAIDTREDRLELARKFGAQAVLATEDGGLPERILDLTRGRGVDGALVTAATDSDAPVRDAARMARKRGRIILVGVAGLRLARADFYAKELKLQVSCSYGPGRYDPDYEARGRDYPLPFVRWTEQRNFEAVLELLANGRLSVEPLVSHRFAFDRAQDAYAALLDDPGALAILLTYDPGEGSASDLPPATIFVPHPTAPAARTVDNPGVAVIGAGNYARRFLLPALQDAGARLVTLAAQGSPLAGWAARKAGFEQVSSDPAGSMVNGAIDAVVIATRHDTHARYVSEALAAGKHVFVEKPLALSEAELREVEAAYAAAGARGARPILMVGFNRRYAPHAIELQQRLARVTGSRCLVYTVNAGAIAADHWTQDPEIGGGRLVGEACHFLDLLRFLVGRPITTVTATALAPGANDKPPESASITLGFADGSIGTVHYFANGARAFPKERIEVFAGGDTWQLNNFRSLISFSRMGPRVRLPGRQDKGNRACIRAFIAAIRNGSPSPMPFAEIVEVSRATLEAARQARSGAPAAAPPGRPRA
jgi:predicted dehydrogenase/threonine dehydrogenase-like Zn-dependent dehydrogenase